MYIIIVSSMDDLGINSFPMGTVSKSGFLIENITKYWRWFSTSSTKKMLRYSLFLMTLLRSHYARTK